MLGEQPEGLQELCEGCHLIYQVRRRVWPDPAYSETWLASLSRPQVTA
jgi:hypothetical protein